MTKKLLTDALNRAKTPESINRYKAWGIRTIAFLLGLIVSGIFAAITLQTNPFQFYGTLIDGVFGSGDRFMIFVRDAALLLGVGIAIVPAFKMRFWNLGANGQVLIGALVASIVTFYLRGKAPDFVQIILAILASMLAGAVWAVLPAIFKALFKTNESLFTLMMNYIAVGLVEYFIMFWFPSTGSYIRAVTKELVKMPTIGGNVYIIPIITVALLTAFMYIYLRFSKHGYEVAVVGESENTARYIGTSVKKVVIRTLILSGLICGLMGFLICGSIGNFQVNKDIVENRGFTAIIVTWLANFNPLVMIFTSFLLMFFTNGSVNTRSFYGLTTTAISDITIGIIFFFIIGSEFFIYMLNQRMSKVAAFKEKDKGKDTEKEKDTTGGKK
ncbi:MAG: ABC transporter permease [Clostridia bacterium]|nr:ABC transporter permease [Clostridia bacterium]